MVCSLFYAIVERLDKIKLTQLDGLKFNEKQLLLFKNFPNYHLNAALFRNQAF